jgi:hypothetical protein
MGIRGYIVAERHLIGKGSVDIVESFHRACGHAMATGDTLAEAGHLRSFLVDTN